MYILFSQLYQSDSKIRIICVQIIYNISVSNKCFVFNQKVCSCQQLLLYLGTTSTQHLGLLHFALASSLEYSVILEINLNILKITHLQKHVLNAIQLYLHIIKNLLSLTGEYFCIPDSHCTLCLLQFSNFHFNMEYE